MDKRVCFAESFRFRPLPVTLCDVYFDIYEVHKKLQVHFPTFLLQLTTAMYFHS